MLFGFFNFASEIAILGSLVSSLTARGVADTEKGSRRRRAVNHALQPFG